MPQKQARRPLTDEEKAKRRESLAIARRAKAEKRSEQPTVYLKDAVAFANRDSEAEIVRLKDELRVRTQELDVLRSNPYRLAALRALALVRRQVFERCDCKKKAMLKTCERYSCKHLLQIMKSIESIAVTEGVFPAMPLEMPKFRDAGRHQTKQPDFDWESETLYSEARAYDERGRPLLPAGRGVGLPDDGPKSIVLRPPGT